MGYYENLPIYKKSLDVAVYFEGVVKNFSRYHKYTIGADFRNLSRQIVLLIARANLKKERLEILLDVREKLEDLKILIRICKEIEAFRSFKSFEYAMRQVVEMSKQNEGWIKKERSKAKNKEK